ncbi:MAG: serine/threonine protein phosphatase [Lachnospiraceae bacterium]|nr:serine/threonine protein phosphatase [Lachnospiraceae bacterium]
MRTIIIGDIHGCSGALRMLLAKILPDATKDKLIFLGDLFDRGPDSWGVFQMIQELAESYGDRFVLLRGNHEDYLLQQKLPLGQRFVWERVGRGATVKSFKAHGARMEDSAGWIRERAAYYYRGEGFQCVHAGLKIDPMELNDFYTMIHDHNVAMENVYAGPLTIVGHIALEKPTWFPGEGKPVKTLEEGKVLELPQRGVICIDTGCGKGGRLTGMVIEDGKYSLISTGEEG